MADKKKKLIKAFVITGVVLVCLFVLSLILERIVINDNTPTLDYKFYEPTEEEDYFTDPEYMSKDRYLYYTDEMGQRTAITEESDITAIGPTFFRLYFFAVEQGDHGTLNSLYADSFEDHTAFTPQRVYAKELKYLYDEKIDDNTFSITYSLDYNIMKNDGSFRRDIGSDMSRTQYITLYYTAEDAWIEEVKTEYRK